MCVCSWRLRCVSYCVFQSDCDFNALWLRVCVACFDLPCAFAEVCDWRQQTSGGLQASSHSERLTGPVKVTARDVWLTGEGTGGERKAGRRRFCVTLQSSDRTVGTRILYIQSRYPEFHPALAWGQGCVAFTLWRLAVLLQFGLQIKNNIHLVLIHASTQEESVPFLLGIGRQTSD